MVRAARALLGSVTRVLLLADIVVVKQLLLAKDRVSRPTPLVSSCSINVFISLQISRTLGRLESVATFTEFVKAFSVFGAEMVELAHITGKKPKSFPFRFTNGIAYFPHLHNTDVAIYSGGILNACICHTNLILSSQLYEFRCSRYRLLNIWEMTQMLCSLVAIRPHEVV